MTEFLLIIVGICLQYDCSVTSWIRTASRNKILGGHPESFHLAAMAIDLVPDNQAQTPKIIARLERLGVRAIANGGYIHAQPEDV